MTGKAVRCVLMKTVQQLLMSHYIERSLHSRTVIMRSSVQQVALHIAMIVLLPSVSCFVNLKGGSLIVSTIEAVHLFVKNYLLVEDEN